MNVDSRAIPTEPERIEALDGVRGLAIVAVVVMHTALFAPLLPIGDAELLKHYMRFALLGWCGVDVFFVLSGFLITGILVRSKGAPHYFRNFYARRALRIFPLYYLVIALLLFVLPRPAASGAEIASCLLYYQNLFLALSGHGSPDPARVVTWSLAIEEQFYLLWPTLVLLTSKVRLRQVCVAAIGLAIGSRLLTLQAGQSAHFLTWCRMDTLAAGALLAVMPLPPAWIGRFASLLGVGGLCTAMLVTGDSLPEKLVMQQWGLPAALSLAVGVLVLARHGGWFASACSWRPLRSIGKYSYCIYLTHWLVIEKVTDQVAAHRCPAWWNDGVRQWPTLVVVITFTLLCLAAAWVVALFRWNLLERPVLSLKRRFPSGG